MKETMFGWLPITASDIAGEWDVLFYFLLAISIFFFVLVVGGMVYFAWKYRAGKRAEREAIEGHVPLEIAWTAIPTVLLLILFGWGWNVYVDMISVPADPYEVKVIGKQWGWTFVYDDGRSSSNEVFVPLDRPVRFVMTSEDVLHSFFIPNFRIKQDVVPGMYTSVWFHPKIAGDHQVFCAEYCGGEHSRMIAKVRVLDSAQWHEWSRGRSITTELVGVGKPMLNPVPMKSSSGSAGDKSEVVKKGEALAAAKGCVACHSADGSARVGPTWKGLWGSEREFADGTKAKADENYIRESIENPTAKIVKGMAPTMPVYKGQISEEEYGAFIAYIKSLK